MHAQQNLAEVFGALFNPKAEEVLLRYTLDEAIEFWLKIKKGTIDQTSYQRYEEYMNNFRDFWRVKSPALKFVDEVTPELVKDFMDYGVGEKRLSTKTVNSARQALSNLFETLIQYDKYQRNPAAKVTLLKNIKRQKRRCLSADELKLIFKQAEQETDGVFWRPMFVTFFMTGMRRDEVRKLQKHNVDLVNGFIRVTETKTDHPKVIPIHPQLFPYLKNAIEGSCSDLVFPNRDGSMLNKNKIREKLMRICAKVGIPAATVHDFRHTFASQHGLSRDTRQKIGGWSSRQVMEKTYIHTPEDNIKQEYCSMDFTNVLE